MSPSTESFPHLSAISAGMLHGHRVPVYTGPACSPYEGPPSVSTRTSAVAPCTSGDGLGTPRTGQVPARVAPRCALGPPRGAFVTRRAHVSLRASSRARRSGAEVEVLLRRCARRADGLDAVG